MIGFLKSLHRHQFFTLSSGVVVANVINLAFMPVLTRIYSVESFGYFALYFSFSNIAGVLATLRLESAIPICKEEDTREVAFTGIVNVSLVSLFLTSIFWIVLHFDFFHAPPELKVPLVINSFLSAWAVGFMQVQAQINVRFGNLKAISWRYIIERISMLGFAWLLFKGEPLLGLIYSQTISHFVSIGVMHRKRPWRSLDILRFKFQTLLRIFRDYRDFPSKGLPSLLAQSFLSNGAPLVYSAFFPASLVGLYSLAQRLVDAPNAMFQTAFATVYYRRLLSANPKDRPRLFWIFVKVMTPFAVLGAILLFFTADRFVEVLFGAQWIESSRFLVLMIPLIFIRPYFLVLQSWLVALRRLDVELRVSILAFAMYWLGIGIGTILMGSLETSVLLSSLSVSAVYIFGIYAIYRLVQGK